MVGAIWSSTAICAKRQDLDLTTDFVEVLRLILPLPRPWRFNFNPTFSDQAPQPEAGSLAGLSNSILAEVLRGLDGTNVEMLIRRALPEFMQGCLDLRSTPPASWGGDTAVSS